MKKLLGYMLTWTTYGSWLQGDKRGYVDDGQVIAGNTALKLANMNQQKSKTVKLSVYEKDLVRKAIIREGQILGQQIYSLAVCTNHVHIVLNHIEIPIEKVVSHYKNAVRLALKSNGFNGKLWTQGYDKRYCFNEKELNTKIDYVCKHNQ